MSLELPPPTWPSLAKGHTGLPVASDWQQTMADDGFPYGKTEAKWNEAAVRQAQRIALESAAQLIERAQVRMKLPGNQAFCIYDANMAEEVRKLAEGLEP